MSKWRWSAVLAIGLAVVGLTPVQAGAAPATLQGQASLSYPGREWHVAVTGSDRNDGSAGAPFASPQKGLDAVQPGETVVIHAGSYTVPNGVILKDRKGTAQAPITIRGEGRPVLRGAAVDQMWVWNGLVNIERSSHVQVTGLRLEDSGWFGFKVDSSPSVSVIDNEVRTSLASAVYVSSSPGVVVKKNDVSDFCAKQQNVRGSSCQEGITISDTDGFTVSANLVHDAKQGNGLTGGGGEGIDAKGSSKNGVICFNEVRDLVQVGIYVDAWDSADNGNIRICRNRVSRVPSGIVVSAEDGGQVTGMKIMDNVLSQIGNNGIEVSSWMKNGPRRDITIEHNTIHRVGYRGSKAPWCVQYSCTDSGSGIFIGSANISNVAVRDNLVSDPVSANVRLDSSVRASVSVDTNLFATTRAGDWRGATNTVVGDPRLADPAGGDFSLQPGSPAAGRATNGTDLGSRSSWAKGSQSFWATLGQI
ncbi:MAG: right-handed parallel beta-helix repeat-containing protein [Angustibacter sp.]